MKLLFLLWLLWCMASESWLWWVEHRPTPDPIHTAHCLHASALIHRTQEDYTRRHRWAIHLGNLALLPSLWLMHRRHHALTRERDVAGQVITPEDRTIIEKRYHRLQRRPPRAPSGLTRNQLWLGVDLRSGEDVVLDGEGVFQGMMIVGGQGTGKTSRYVKTILKQLADDPMEKTSVVNFTLKRGDADDAAQFFGQRGLRVVPWQMGNLLDLARNRDGVFEESTLLALLQGAAWGAGLGSKADSFWLDGAMNQLTRTIQLQLAQGRAPTLGDAFIAYEREALEQADNRMVTSFLETLRRCLSPFAIAGDRLNLLYSQGDGGLHWGPLHLNAGARFREWTQHGVLDHVAPEPLRMPHGFYELDPGARRAMDWDVLLQPTALILPPGGSAATDRFALNFIKTSLGWWFARDAADGRSRLLVRDPTQRRRIVVAQDEAHNFISHQGAFSDGQMLATYRESGYVYVGATQSLSKLMEPGKSSDHFLSVVGTWLFLRTSGKDPAQVVQFLGKTQQRWINRSYGRSQAEGGRSDSGGRVHTDNTRANVTESVQDHQRPFISEDIYRQFKPGMALLCRAGEPYRVIYCPYHDQAVPS